MCVYLADFIYLCLVEIWTKGTTIDNNSSVFDSLKNCNYSKCEFQSRIHAEIFTKCPSVHFYYGRNVAHGALALMQTEYSDKILEYG